MLEREELKVEEAQRLEEHWNPESKEFSAWKKMEAAMMKRDIEEMEIDIIQGPKEAEQIKIVHLLNKRDVEPKNVALIKVKKEERKTEVTVSAKELLSRPVFQMSMAQLATMLTTTRVELKKQLTQPREKQPAKLKTFLAEDNHTGNGTPRLPVQVGNIQVDAIFFVGS
ncbi:hypothetical protein PHYBLDRAFT_173280 [Phycomyces blakesleeanus NRRL 1555(-)]|uniref:Uncharacterized protein n=1 Tax=Phycomyces blakesleeanus (strain ATCC 8743b / DSM 1359 / FGSC 10004 / NBRC 33097 / NRRL 1555) TaxID=763407 RepID=A0A162ND06_PHYB8|nr:hypothetical protein PHYBLDRAFT_173280 [Phycomyces blakesleeanus NRRL 1555(-)]OAD68274.1 hypothetical protein PHYBLDRAFT_173280 [Phycomyces blakesleeanus NRRL 1555(-)]|eukprot:XP_018286314.1 hypothetical protein PHYBLDRAFT_173280 [Phycomyces blakesleeanus NRRL 1555(-)]